MVDAIGSGWGLADEVVGSFFQWFKVVGGTIKTVVVTSESATTYQGHWAQGAVRPCQGSSCKFCAERIGVQRRFAFSVVDIEKGTPAVLEVGLPTALCIKELSEAAGTLRGLTMAVSREGGRKRGRVLVHRVEDLPVLPADLPPALDVPALLRATWKRLI